MTGSDRPCPDDLLARARSGGLAELERRALAAHVTNCAACATSDIVAALFREGADSSPRDASIVARVAHRVGAKRAAGHGARPWRGRAFATALLILLALTSGALAWVGRQGGGLRSVFRHGVNVPTSASNDLISRHTPTSVGKGALPQKQIAIVDASVPHPRRRAAPGRVAIAPVMAGEPALSAATMFADANATRRRGDLRAALSVYQALRRQFPETSEARLSAISMGDVLLDLRSPGRALEAYGDYLVENASGSLREEALFGRTRCLRALDRGPAELDTWRALLAEFPRSAYASLAQRRMSELQR
jgi:hypothetical protein